MARSGKKCLFEDDVRALLGMQPPVEAVCAANTSLEQQFSVNKGKQMTAKLEANTEDETSILGPAFSGFGRKLMLVVVCIALLSLIGILVFEEMERSDRKKIHQVQIKGDTSGLPLQESPVVTKDNWKTLQQKADHARRQRIRSLNPRARAIQERAAREAEEREKKVVKQMEHEMGPKGAHGSSWAQKAGGPHSGAKSGQYGQFW